MLTQRSLAGPHSPRRPVPTTSRDSTARPSGTRTARVPTPCLALWPYECKAQPRTSRAGSLTKVTDSSYPSRTDRMGYDAGHRIHRCRGSRCPAKFVWTGRLAYTDSGNDADLLRLRALLALRDLELDAL